MFKNININSIKLQIKKINSNNTQFQAIKYSRVNARIAVESSLPRNYISETIVLKV